MKTIIVILLSATCMFGYISCAGSNSTPENINMEQQVYTLGVWKVKEGRQEEFIVAWKELDDIFKALPAPPGKGILIQSISEPELFYSFGPWDSLEAVETMRKDHRAQEGIRKLVDLCIEATPGSFYLVAESP